MSSHQTPLYLPESLVEQFTSCHSVLGARGKSAWFRLALMSFKQEDWIQLVIEYLLCGDQEPAGQLVRVGNLALTAAELEELREMVDAFNQHAANSSEGICLQHLLRQIVRYGVSTPSTTSTTAVA